MQVTERSGFLVEVQDSSFTSVGAELVAWVSSPMPERMVLGCGRGTTIAKACLAALKDWRFDGDSLYSPLTAREVRIADLLACDVSGYVSRSLIRR